MFWGPALPGVCRISGAPGPSLPWGSGDVPAQLQEGKLRHRGGRELTAGSGIHWLRGASSCPTAGLGCVGSPRTLMGTPRRGTAIPPHHSHPRAGQALCPSWGGTKGPWGPSPSRRIAAARGLPTFPWRPAAFSLPPFLLPFPISRRCGRIGSRHRRGAAGRGERGGSGGGPCHAMPGRASPSAAVGAFFRHPEEKPEPRPPRSLFPLRPCRRPTHRCGVAGPWGYGVIGWVIGVTEPLRSLQTSFSGSGCSKLGATSCPTKPG